MVPIQDLTTTWLHAGHFAAQHRRVLEQWQQRIDQWSAGGRRLALWGAGCKGAAFLNALEAEGRVMCVVDSNPGRQGRYVTGSGQLIVGPEDLVQHRPHIIIVMNPAYLEEIGQQLAVLGLSAEMIAA